MPTYTFQPVTTQRLARGKCPVCGKPVTRTKTFQCTINPFNLNERGVPRDPSEVRAQVNAKAAAWVPDFTHTKCAEKAE